MPPHFGILRRPLFRAVPRQEAERPYYGRATDLKLIDMAMRSANRGYMRPLTDLSLETLRLDGHTSALWQKRLNRVASCTWTVEAATGRNVDKGKAQAYADEVRAQLDAIPHFKQCLMDLNWGTYHGRAASEIDWQLEGGEWQVRGLNWIHARRLSFGPNRDLRVIDLSREIGNFQDQGCPIEDPRYFPYKFCVFKPRMFGDYAEREGLAPRAIFWSFFGRFPTRERLHLVEIFGKPWRIAIPKEAKDGSWPNEEQLDDAFDQLNSLGPHSTARLPVGMDVMISQPTKGAGDVHAEAIDHAEKTLSKLFLGGTAGTDAVSTGLGSGVSEQHRDAEDLIIESDCWRLGEAFEDQVTDAIIVVNHGPDEVDHAPSFKLTIAPPVDRAKEAATVRAWLDVGLDISLAEVRERSGMREVEPGEPVVRIIERNIKDQIPMHPPLPQVVYPTGKSPDRGVIADIPLVPGTVDNPGLGGTKDPTGGALPPGLPPAKALPPAPGDAKPPPALPSPNPGGDDEPKQTHAERLAAEMTEHQVERCAHEKVNRCQLCGIERVRGLALDDDGAPVQGEDGKPAWRIEWQAIPAKPVVAASSRRRLSSADGRPDPSSDISGMHEHALVRNDERVTMAMGGEHWHVFDVDGAFVWTEVGGPHEHRPEQWGGCSAGEHFHRITVGGGLRDTELGGHHYHERGVETTGVGGVHGHTLKLPDGRVAYALGPDEYADLIDADDEADAAHGGALAWHPQRRAASDLDETVRLLGPYPSQLSKADRVLLATRSPESLYGSPDKLVTRGVDTLAPITKALGDAIARAVDGKTSSRTIRAAIDRAAAGFGTRRIAEALERELRMGAMLGALDAHWESETDDKVEVASFAELYRERLLLTDHLLAGPSGDRGFTGHPLADAIKAFLERKPVTRPIFDRMTTEAKRQAFTVAGATSREVVASVKRELVRQVELGADLRDFATAATERLEAAGWVPNNPSHVETVFRTNVQRAYSDGRAKQMTQPEVLEARPCWQCLGIGDSRQRDTHEEVDGTVYEATDPIFATLFTPFDFNCRCRFRSLTRKAAERIGISDGSALEVVRNPHFKCGLGGRAPG